MYKAILGFILILIFIGVYLFLYFSGLSENLFNSKELQDILVSLNNLGPLLIILLMSGAIVMSPLPSAPIAIASGYVYGHSWGTIYIILGAEIGAIIAFTISRLLGYEAIQQRFGNKIESSWLNSSRHLMLLIFISRLIPFISFDAISYAAGLTKISYMQFSIATLLGIIPMSFLLAHLGSEIDMSDLESLMLTVFLIGFITIIPLIYSLTLRQKESHD